MVADREGKMTGKIGGHGSEERRPHQYEFAKWTKSSCVLRARDLSLCHPVVEQETDAERSWASRRNAQ
jgi:hypothetical protein